MANNYCTENRVQNSNGCAVNIRNLCKMYNGGPPIINNLSMTVQQGSIYGLLGSSGCGKTTILSCIIGIRKWDSGDVLVYGRKPGSKGSGIPGKMLGYMPQDIALFKQLSIREIMQFYGRLYNMTDTDILKRWKDICNLLELPLTFKTISELSGGQQRRVSLALALIHSPKLLILDEPTVGVDPLLRQSIWEHLCKLVNSSGTTILVTTHYIEETRLFNTIGILRNGRLIAEDSPQILMDFYNSDSLDKVLLHICQKDDENKKHKRRNDHQTHEALFGFHYNVAALPDIIPHNDCEQVAGNCDSDGIHSTWSFHHFCKRVYALTIVLLLQLIRYPAFLITFLFIPAIHGCLTMWVFGSKPMGMHFGIVNHDVSNWTLECESPKYAVDCCELSGLSCKYLNQLRYDNILILNSYENVEDAISAAHSGTISGYLVFETNYSLYTMENLVYGRFASNESISGSKIHAHIDYSQSPVAFSIVKSLYTSFQEYIKKVTMSYQISEKYAEFPLMYRSPVYGTYKYDFKMFVLPGTIICNILVFLSVLSSFMFLSDRKQETLNRSSVAGLGTNDTLLSYIITLAFVVIGQIMIWTLALEFVFGMEIEGSMWLLLVFCILAGLCGTNLGLFIGIHCKDELEALIVETFLFVAFVLLGGIVFPLELMSSFWRYVGYLTPISIPTLSLRSVAVRGLDWMNPLVWPGLVVLVGWMLVLYLLILISYRSTVI